ncbi:hypothetical protein CHU92_05200 [Flavobacterium cyanobacteriorum]|uniref:Mis12-Mtw1 protein family n=1 Tax=Flavobacterium cyanobacteriorum TaxID=2022802 RepID=A0A255ZAD9_9FLAO|nr:hypothetical protein [Flavobacterium cyanobacteriorum]OYQ38402.1 hypothetical protein CHU92_05200 [Flavobacterium cyanobacteriorum]
MSGLTELVDSLELKLDRLVQKAEQLEKANQELKNEISRSASVIRTQSGEIDSLKKQIESLRIANSLLGSDDNKRETKLKINSLIREIDYCIAQLSD